MLGIAPYVGDALAGLSLRRLDYLAETGLVDPATAPSIGLARSPAHSACSSSVG